MTTVHMNDGRTFEVEESVDLILNSAKGQLSFVRLTKVEDGLPIHINLEYVAFVMAEDTET